MRSEVDRVGVFIDYENAHRVAHGLYADISQQLHDTVIDPLRIAQRLVGMRRHGGGLAQVHVYRGRPLPQFQPEATSANDMLADAWAKDGVTVLRRDLKYTTDERGRWSAQEKGIDVALAVGVVEAAMNNEIDVAVVFSTDTDQMPTLELVFHKLQTQAEVACWSPAKPLWFPEMLQADPPRRLPYCHFLHEQDFVDCRDYRGRLEPNRD
jgi:uncharacterized LabA/DUF88 family protein